LILLDANILLYAFDSKSVFHKIALSYLEEAINTQAVVGLSWLTVLAFVRITTSSKSLVRPLSFQAASQIIVELLEQDSVKIIDPSPEFWKAFVTGSLKAQVKGGLTTDAFLAALAIERGLTLVSADKDFLRFEGLKLFNPFAQL